MAKGIVFDFTANVARFQSNIDKITNDLSKFQTNADRISKNVNKSFDRLGSGLQGLRGVLGGLTAGISVAELAKMAETYTNIQARLKLATRNADEFAQANANIRRIADSTKAPLEATATLYTRIAQSLIDVGGTQQQIANTTQALALGLRISGATAEESASAMQQFSQAIASGVLRGEEFNSVNEAAPRVMKALADALGVPVGKLREMAHEGKLTRDILVEGLGSQLPKMIREAETLPNTIGTAFTDAKNELLLTVGVMDKLTGASSKAADAVAEIGKAFRVLRGGLESDGSLFGWAISTPEEEAKAAETVANLEQKVARMKKMRDELSVPTVANRINDFIFGDVKDLNIQISVIESKIAHLNGLAKKAAQITKVEQPDDSGAGMKALLAKAEAEKKAAEAEKARIAAAKAAEAAAKAFAAQQQTFIDGLQKEADTLGMTSAQLKVYEASLLKITGARLAGVKANAERIEAFQAEQKVLEDMRESYAEAAESYLKFIGTVAKDNKAATEKVERLKVELGLVEKSEAQQKRMLALYDLEVKVKERLKELDGLDTGDSVRKIQEEAILKAKASEEEAIRLEEQINKQKKAASETQKVWDNFGFNLQRNLGDQLFNTFEGKFDDIGKSWKSLLFRMAADAAAANLSKVLFGADGTGGSGLLGKGLSLLGSVLGLFGGGGAGGGTASYTGYGGLGAPRMFAKGGIVDSPTPFRFAEGGAFRSGLMGEAGPEAIMPLKRDSQGRLGVSSHGRSGGGVVINQTINIDSRTDRAEVHALVFRAVRQGNADLVDKLSRQGVI